MYNKNLNKTSKGYNIYNIWSMPGDLYTKILPSSDLHCIALYYIIILDTIYSRFVCIILCVCTFVSNFKMPNYVYTYYTLLNQSITDKNQLMYNLA